MRPKAVKNHFAPAPPPLPSPHWLYDLQDIHNKLMYSFHIRQICPLKGSIVSTHRFSCPARPPAPLPLVQTQAPTPLKTPPSPHWLYDLQDTLDKLMHFLPQLSGFVPSKTGFTVSAHKLTNIILLTLVQATL